MADVQQRANEWWWQGMTGSMMMDLLLKFTSYKKGLLTLSIP
jgi:hypothetical protein